MSSSHADFTPDFSPGAGLSGDQLTPTADFYESVNYQHNGEAHGNFEDPLFASILQSGYADPTLLNVQSDIDDIPTSVSPNRVLDRASAAISQIFNLAQANPDPSDFGNNLGSHDLHTDQDPESGTSWQGQVCCMLLTDDP